MTVDMRRWRQAHEMVEDAIVSGVFTSVAVSSISEATGVPRADVLAMGEAVKAGTLHMPAVSLDEPPAAENGKKQRQAAKKPRKTAKTGSLSGISASELNLRPNLLDHSERQPDTPTANCGLAVAPPAAEPELEPTPTRHIPADLIDADAAGDNAMLAAAAQTVLTALHAWQACRDHHQQQAERLDSIISHARALVGQVHP